jgi:hypothetical protein
MVRPADPRELIGRMVIAFRAQAAFWRVLGARSPGVCQFHVEGASIPSWFVELSSTGALVRGGDHPRPSATWSSSAASIVAIMCGEERVDDVRIEGDLELLSALFRGLASRI